MPEQQAPLRRWLAWFVGLWALSVTIVGVVAWLLRMWLLG